MFQRRKLTIKRRRLGKTSISAPERRRREQARGVRGHDPPGNFENQFLQISLFLKYGLYFCNFLTKMFAKSVVFNAFGKLITVIVPFG